jgi:hypothetical protein
MKEGELKIGKMPKILSNDNGMGELNKETKNVNGWENGKDIGRRR